MTEPETPSLRVPGPAVVRRALGIAVAWAYVAALAALLVVGLAVLVAALVTLILAVVDADRSFVWSDVWTSVKVVAWVAFPLAGIVAVWTAAYGSTQEGSVRRSVVAVMAALVAGGLAWWAGSLALPLAALAAGWTFAVPAEHPARWLLRVVLAAVAVPFFPQWGDQQFWVTALAVLGGPLGAGLSVGLGDALWSVVTALRSRGDGGVVRSPSSLDV